MKVLPLHREIIDYLKIHKLEKKFSKQVNFLKNDIRYPSLNVELLEPKHLKFYSFRIDKKYRAIFIFTDENTIEIIDANDHYQ